MASSERRLQLAAAIGSAAVMAVGIVFLGWPAFTVLALYWLENVIVGIFTALRILAVGALTGRYVGSLLTTAFFCVHYGLFCLVHGVFVAALFGGMRPSGSFLDPVLLMVGRVAGDRVGALVVAAMVVAAAADAWRSLKTVDPEAPDPLTQVMNSPYGRIVVLHLVLIGGGMLMMLLGLPSVAALLLVAFKLAYDLRQWLRGAPEAVRA
jgi:hypothetical protein